MRHLIERSFLIRRVERYEVEMSDLEDPQHFIDNHLEKFDADVVAHGALLGTEVQGVDYPELKLKVVDRGSAKIIPLRRGDS